MMAWTLIKMDLYNEPLYDAIAARVNRQWRGLNPVDLSSLSLSFARCYSSFVSESGLQACHGRLWTFYLSYNCDSGVHTKVCFKLETSSFEVQFH